MILQHTLKHHIKELAEKLTEAHQLMKDGTQEEVDNMLQSLAQAVSHLKQSGQKEYEEYLKSVQLKDEKMYTEDSYQVYKAAYNHIMNLGDDVSIEDFIMVKNKF